MNNVRMILYILLGAVSIVLWNNWQKDYPPPTAPNAITTNNVIDSNNKLPAAGLISKGSGALNNTISAKTPASKLITVKTDTLEVLIDTLGGNIIQAKLRNYPLTIKDSNIPVTLLDNKPDNLYLAISGVITATGSDETLLSYRSDRQNYQLDPTDKEVVVQLNWRDQSSGLSIAKIFTFERGKYAVKVNHVIENGSKRNQALQFFAKLVKRDHGDNEVGFFGFRTYAGAAVSSADKPYEKISYDSLSKESFSRTIQGGWLAFQERYFLAAWVPPVDRACNYFSRVLADKTYVLGLRHTLNLVAGEKVDLATTLYAGPEIAANLQTVAKHLDLTVDYGWLWLIAVGLFWVMRHIYNMIGNWGWSIVIVTILIKVFFYKFSEKSYESMAKMRNLSPQLKSLKQRFGDDKQKLQQATMEIYRKAKVNPLGGCLPVLIQIPVFIALYYVLVAAVELRQAPFMLWIHDLAAKDPYYILPIFMGLSMLAQQKLNPPPPDPVQAKMMMFLPLIFTVFFVSFPSGLVLYWLVNNCLSVLQQWYIMRKMDKKVKS